MEEKTHSSGAVILRNILAFILGILAFVIATYILSFIMTLILSIPFVAQLLSWPSSPMLYAVSAVNLGAVGAAYLVCNFVSLPTASGKRPATILLMGLLGLFTAVSTVLIILSYGFTEQVFAQIIGILACFYFAGQGFRE